MSLNNFSVTNFFKNGFYVYKNLLDKDEIKNFNIGFELVHPGEFDIKYYIKYKQIKKILS
jgi:hypothetical protein